MTFRYLIFSFVVLFLFYSRSSAQWVDAYYIGTSGDSVPPNLLYFPAITNIMHYTLEPTIDGNIRWTGGTNSSDIGLKHSSDLLTTAHAAGKKVLLVLGGGTTDMSIDFYNIAAQESPQLLAGYVAKVINFMKQYGLGADQQEQYDGLDLDWEFLWALADPPFSHSKDSITAGYKALVYALRAALDNPDNWPPNTPRKMFTVAIMATKDSASLAMYDQLLAQNIIDHFNMETYCLAGPYENGMLTWHNSAVTTPDTIKNYLLSSVDFTLRYFLSLNNFSQQPQKLALGSPFTGIVWHGVQELLQPATVPGTYIIELPYSEIMKPLAGGGYFDTARYEWMDDNKAAILHGLPNNEFVSVESQRGIHAKFDYLRSHYLGGFIIWNVAGGYRTGTLPPELPDSLLRTVDAERSPVTIDSLPVSAGWNLLSVPLFLFDNAVHSAFGSNTAAAYEYSNAGAAGSTPARYVRSGVGYWVYYAGQTPFASVPMRGGALTRLLVPIRQGWNVIGSLTAPVAAANIQTLPSSGSSTQPQPVTAPFSFEPGSGYTPAEALAPGKAFWMYFNSPGYAVIDASAGAGTPPTASYNAASGSVSQRGKVVLVSPENFAAGMPAAVTLQWDSPVQNVFYRVQVSRSVDFSGQIDVDMSNLTQPTAQVTLSPGIQYYWRACSVNVNGEQGPWSETWQMITGTSGDNTPPSVSGPVVAGVGQLDEFTLKTSGGQGQTLFVRNGSRGIKGALLLAEDMPPEPMTGIFHAKFASPGSPTGKLIGYIPAARAMDDSSITTMPILMNNVSFPLTLRWKVNSENNARYWLSLDQGRRIIPLADTNTIVLGWGDVRGQVALAGQDITPLRTNSLQKHEAAAKDPKRPAEFGLEGNYPNPFNPTTVIRYELPQDAHVVIKIYNTLGALVQTVVDEHETAGYKSVMVDLRGFSSGVYFYQISAGSFSAVRKMILAK